jgi:hypothetical protein
VTDEGTLYSSFVFNDQPPKYDPQMNFLVPAGYFLPAGYPWTPLGRDRQVPAGYFLPAGYPWTPLGLDRQVPAGYFFGRRGKKYPAGTKKFIWGSYLGG